jgi:hypothetical protein
MAKEKSEKPSRVKSRNRQGVISKPKQEYKVYSL